MTYGESGIIEDTISEAHIDEEAVVEVDIVQIAAVLEVHGEE